PGVAREIAEVTEFEWRYDDAGSGAFEDASIWRPLPPPGFVSLGDVAVAGHQAPKFAARVVREVPGLTAEPLGYERIWDDDGSLGANAVALWGPIPPLGFECLGTVAQQVHEVPPPTQVIRCVHREALRRGAASLISNDAGSGAWENAGLWRCDV